MRRRKLQAWWAGFAVLVPWAAVSAAEPEAQDAFGARIGNERIGLYGEDQVRGFALEEAGNYRIDGAYFVRAVAPSNALVTGSTTRLGANALRHDFPAASGIIDYRLRAIAPGRSSSVGIGWRGHSGPFLEPTLNLAGADGREGVVASAILAPSQRYSDGSEGEYYGLGLVSQWRPSAALRVRGLAEVTRWRYQADTGYLPLAGGVLPRIERRYNGQPWTLFDRRSLNLGVLVDGAQVAGWDLQGAAFVSRTQRERSDFNLYSQVARDGTAQATVFVVGPQSARAASAELRASRVFGGQARRHRVAATLRLRDSRARTDAGTPFALGPVNIFADVPRVPPPALPPASHTRDDVDQATLGAGYRLELGTRATVGVGVQRTRYAKTVVVPDGSRTQRTEGAWLHDASVVIALGSRTTAFATATRSLEESGVAPQNAANRNAVLPPVLATQYEAGLKWQLTDSLALIANGFDLRKPVPGVGGDGVYRLVGDARHRGVELSLSGDVAEGLNLMLGALWMRPEVLGVLVEQGAVDDEALGRSGRIAVANLSWTPSSAPGWTFDAAATYNGPRQADRTSTVRTPGYTVFDAGLRHRFALAGGDASLRLRVLNVGDTYAWFATPSQLQFFNRGRAAEMRLDVQW